MSEPNSKEKKYVLLATQALGYILNLVSVQSSQEVKTFYENLLNTYIENEKIIKDNFLHNKLGGQQPSGKNFKRLYVILKKEA